MTFIHGPNGCGKTTFLKLISYFFEWDITSLNKINFKSLDIYYEDGHEISVEKSTIKEKFDDEKVEIPVLNFRLKYDGKIRERFKYKCDIKDLKIHPSELDEYIPFLQQVGLGQWLDVRSRERLSYHQVIDRFKHKLPFSNAKKRPEWLLSSQKDAKLHFVQTQRLLKVTYERHRHRGEEQNVENVIEIYSKEISKQISDLMARSAEVSQSKDRSFPQRLLTMKLDAALSEPQIREDYQKTETKIEKLMESGLIQQEKNLSLPSQEFEATEKKVLSLYLKDINEKLAVFDDLLLRVETFLSIISQKLRNKSFKVSQKDGFLVETTQGENQVLKPNQLSSGEQHEIVLFYELIFKTSDNSFFLIDEPEISLHIDWQRHFLSDISKIANLGKHSFLIATHSPQIIGSRRDLAVSLDGGILND